MKDYKAIIFDLGNVVFHCSFEPTLEYWASIAGRNSEEIRSVLYLNTDHDNFEKGLITEDEFRECVSGQIGYGLTKTEFEKGWNGIYEETVDGIDTLLKALKKSYRIVGLTNTNETHSKIWKAKYEETLSLFEQVFSSHEIKARKPEAKAYQVCLDYLNVKSEEVIFLDDKIEYTEGAKKLGIDSIQVDSFPQMVATLEDIGIKTKARA